MTKAGHLMKKKAVVLLSGGLDSAVTLYSAKAEGYECHCLTFDYGQRHKKEIEQAGRLARIAGAAIRLVELKLPWGGSSLLDKHADIPRDRSVAEIGSGIPNTYVPGRNTIFLSIAASFAESIGAEAVFIGAHSEDSSGYPDCRMEYLELFNGMVKRGTRAGLEGALELRFPLIDKGKAQIITLGKSLGVPFEFAWSCYEGGPDICMRCDSCVLRAKGFKEAGLKDPALC
jgi:7-cyano-7-deazaguanine synthase